MKAKMKSKMDEKWMKKANCERPYWKIPLSHFEQKKLLVREALSDCTCCDQCKNGWKGINIRIYVHIVDIRVQEIQYSNTKSKIIKKKPSGSKLQRKTKHSVASVYLAVLNHANEISLVLFLKFTVDWPKSGSRTWRTRSELEPDLRFEVQVRELG